MDYGDKLAPVQGFTPGIPWELHLRSYDVYRKKYGDQPALIEGWCRGGFGTYELDQFIPGWREEVSQFAAMKKQIEEFQAELREANQNNPFRSIPYTPTTFEERTKWHHEFMLANPRSTVGYAWHSAYEAGHYAGWIAHANQTIKGTPTDPYDSPKQSMDIIGGGD